MDDEQIVELFWKRDESAIGESEKKFGRYLYKIAYGVLSDPEDAKESVNDAYMRAWNSIPPSKPAVLSTYLGKLTRRSSIDLYRKRECSKRKDSEYSVSLEELEECVSSGNVTESEVDMTLLTEAIDRYLMSLPKRKRLLFVRRYYYFDSLADAASYCGMSVSGAASLLCRMRSGLKNHLKKEGFFT